MIIAGSIIGFDCCPVHGLTNKGIAPEHLGSILYLRQDINYVNKSFDMKDHHYRY